MDKMNTWMPRPEFEFRLEQLLTLGLGIVLCLFLCMANDNVHALENTTILVVGDSLSAAYNMDPKLGWVNLLQDKLNQEDLPHEVVNVSVSGYTTGDGLSRFQKHLSSYHPQIVIIALGTNDGLRGLSLELMKNNLSRMIKLSKAAKAEVLLLGFLLPPNFGSQYRDQFAAVFTDLAKQHQLQEVPFLLKDMIRDPKYIQADGLHPRSTAQPVILNNIWAYLKTLIPKK